MGLTPFHPLQLAVSSKVVINASFLEEKKMGKPPSIGFCGHVRKLVTQIGKGVFQISQINCRHELGLSASHLSNSSFHFGRRI